MRGVTHTCGKCADGWICEAHPDKPWPHDDCIGPGVPCENDGCDFSNHRDRLGLSDSQLRTMAEALKRMGITPFNESEE